MVIIIRMTRAMIFLLNHCRYYGYPVATRFEAEEAALDISGLDLVIGSMHYRILDVDFRNIPPTGTTSQPSGTSLSTSSALHGPLVLPSH